MPKKGRKLFTPLGAAFPVELAQEVLKRAKQEGITVSRFIREAVEEALKSGRKHERKEG